MQNETRHLFVLTSESISYEMLKCEIQMEATKECFPVVLFVFDIG